VRVISVREFIAFSPCDRGSTISQLTRKSIEVSACLPACRGSLPLANYSERQRSVVVGGARPCALIEAAIKLAILRRARVRHSRRTAKNAAPRNAMQRPDATRRDATRRDAAALIKRHRRAKNLRPKNFKASFAQCSRIIPAARCGGSRQTSEFPVPAPRCVPSFRLFVNTLSGALSSCTRESFSPLCWIY